MTSEDIKKILKHKYCSPEFAFFAELRLGTGYKQDSLGRIDGYAIQLWEDLERISFEIKVSKPDFLSEIKKPSKRRQALAFSNRFYFVTPKGLLKPEEIPSDSGLIEVQPNLHMLNEKVEMAYELKIIVKAPIRESIRPTWRFLAAIARRISKTE